MGKAKGKGSTYLDVKEEGRNYCGWEKEAFAAYESTLGGEEKNKRKEISIVIERVSGWVERLLRRLVRARPEIRAGDSTRLATQPQSRVSA